MVAPPHAILRSLIAGAIPKPPHPCHLVYPPALPWIELPASNRLVGLDDEEVAVRAVAEDALEELITVERDHDVLRSPASVDRYGYRHYLRVRYVGRVRGVEVAVERQPAQHFLFRCGRLKAFGVRIAGAKIRRRIGIRRSEEVNRVPVLKLLGLVVAAGGEQTPPSRRASG